MALIGHWSLNGNTNDISGFGNNGTVVGAVTFGAGKIGDAFITGASTGRIDTNIIDNQLPDIFSIAGWVKVKEWGLSQGVFGTRSSPNGFMLYRNAGDSTGLLRTYLHYTNAEMVATTTSHAYSGFQLNTWHHFVVIRGNGFYRTYVDGILRGNTTLSSFSGWNKGTTPFRIGAGGSGWDTRQMDLNDIRLYDHALTEMEIQEIAHAKILHYTFDDMQEPTTNILNNPTLVGETGLANDFQSYGAVTYSISDNSYIYGTKSQRIFYESPTNNGSSMNKGIRCDLQSSEVGKIYTFSFYGKGLEDISAPSFYTTSLSYITGEVIDLENGWKKYIRTYECTSSPSHFYIRPNANNEYSFDMYINAPQWEEKPYATKFTVGLRTGRVNDYSGFFNHSDPLTETTTPRWIADAKIGTGAYQFGTISKFINSSYGLGINPFVIPHTFSIWIKPSSTSNQMFLNTPNGSSQRFYIGINGAKWDMGIQGSAWGTGVTPVTINSWTHIVVTMNNGLAKMYVNGTYSFQKSFTSYTFPANLTIGSRSDYVASGDLDDVRIYATALSDEDIKDLYETRAEILNSGTLQTHDFKQRKNLLQSVNQAIKDKEFKNGLSSYTQANTIVTLTDRGYRIYRTPNVNPTDNGNTMWGGLRIDMTQIPGGIPLTKGRSYRLIINTNGKTTKSPSGSSKFSNQMGWGGGGLTPTPITIGREWEQIPNNFNGKHDIIWEFKIEDDIYKVCTSSYSSFVAGNTYPSYKHLQMGWGYQDTGSEGTEIYITGIYLYDITDDDTIGISDKGIGTFDEYSTVGITDGLVGYYPLSKNANDYSGNNYNGTVNSGVHLNGDHANFDGTTNAYIEAANTASSKLNITSDNITLMTLVRHNGISTAWQGLIFKANYNSDGYQLFFNNQDRIAFGLYTSTGFTRPTTDIQPANEWMLITATYDGINMKIYKNGELISTTPKTGNIISSTNNLQIGRSTTSENLNGDMAYVKIFNRALTEEEIKIEYNTMFKNEVQIHESGTLYAKDLKQY